MAVIIVSAIASVIVVAVVMAGSALGLMLKRGVGRREAATDPLAAAPLVLVVVGNCRCWREGAVEKAVVMAARRECRPSEVCSGKVGRWGEGDCSVLSEWVRANIQC